MDRDRAVRQELTRRTVEVLSGWAKTWPRTGSRRSPSARAAVLQCAKAASFPTSTGQRAAARRSGPLGGKGRAVPGGSRRPRLSGDRAARHLDDQSARVPWSTPPPASCRGAARLPTGAMSGWASSTAPSAALTIASWTTATSSPQPAFAESHGSSPRRTAALCRGPDPYAAPSTTLALTRLRPDLTRLRPDSDSDSDSLDPDSDPIRPT